LDEENSQAFDAVITREAGSPISLKSPLLESLKNEPTPQEERRQSHFKRKEKLFLNGVKENENIWFQNSPFKNSWLVPNSTDKFQNFPDESS
jgi:hypothetical protein